MAGVVWASLDTILTAYRRPWPTPSRRCPGPVTFYDVVPSQPNLPAVVCYPTAATFTRSMGLGADDEYAIAVAALVSASAPTAAGSATSAT